MQVRARDATTEDPASLKICALAVDIFQARVRDIAEGHRVEHDLRTSRY